MIVNTPVSKHYYYGWESHHVCVAAPSSRPP